MSETPTPIPNNILNFSQGKIPVIYKRGEELGHGGFAKVFRAINRNTGEEVAVKVTSRDRLKKQKAAQKHKMEVSIQMSLDHPNIVKAMDFFEDQFFTYLVLELCPGGSLKSLIRKRTKLSENETIKYLTDILNGLSYLHDNRIIHRDLKLENFLIDKNGNIKIADFGLSAKLDYDDERKHSVCGTPNYISPELLIDSEKGISYEVDIWAVGVSAFGMLIGSLPFQTKHTKETYDNIKKCNYKFPNDCSISPAARSFIQSVLQLDPEMRPTALELQYNPWLQSLKCRQPLVEKKQFCIAEEDKNAQSLISNCNACCNINFISNSNTNKIAHDMEVINGFDVIKNNNNNSNNNFNGVSPLNQIHPIKALNAIDYANALNAANNINNTKIETVENNIGNYNDVQTNEIVSLIAKNKGTNNAYPFSRCTYINENIDNNNNQTDIETVKKIKENINKVVETEEPEKMQMPKYLVSRFCDHIGLGYLLLNGCVGACFKDGTRMIMDPHQTFIQYWECYSDPKPQILDIDGTIEEKKISILHKFSSSLKRTSTMFQIPNEKFNKNEPMLHVKYWMRTEDVTLFRMNNRNIQLNFKDRKKLIIFWNIRKLMTVSSIYDFGQLEKLHDVSKRSDDDDIKKRLDIAKQMLSIMSRTP